MFLIMGIAKQEPSAALVQNALVQNNIPSPRLLLPNGAIISTEIVDTPALMSKGLSGRNSLAKNSSMLFAFSQEGFYDFWMPNMNFPIDIIWMDQNYQIVDVSPNVQPMPDKSLEELPKYRSSVPAQYVLETNAGFYQQYDLKVGDKLKLT